MLQRLRVNNQANEIAIDELQGGEGLLEYITPTANAGHVTSGTSQVAGTANQVTAYQFQLVQNVGTLGALAFYGTAGTVDAGSVVVLGIYNEDGTELLVQWSIAL